jgi:putative ABC transport system permease protein
MFKEIIKMASQAMKENTLRSFLTTLGIVIGTAIVIIVLSVGSGIESLILNQVASITSDTVYVEVQVPSTLQGIDKDTQTGRSIGMGVQIKTMKNKDVEDIKKLPNINYAYGMLISQANIQQGAREKIAMIWGVGHEHIIAEGLTLDEGRFYTSNEVRNNQKVIVLGSQIKERLFGSASAMNKSVKVKNQNYRVVGVISEQGTQFFLNIDEMVYIPVTTVQRDIMGIDYLQAIAIKLNDPKQITGTIKQIQKLMRRNHNIKDPLKDDFAIRTMDEAMEIISSVTMGISILLFCLAIISIVVGGVGIMNVMYVAVTERTKEIGLKKAIGAKPFYIKLQFLGEAVFICALGGTLGIILGIFITWLISFVAGLFNFTWPFIITLFPILLAFSISLTTGLIFGYAPANKASALNPIDALRK